MYCGRWCVGSILYHGSLEPGSPPTLYRIKNKKGESLEDFDHVLDMVGHGWAWFTII